MISGLSAAAGTPKKKSSRAKPVNHNQRAKAWLMSSGALSVWTMEQEQAFALAKRDFLACDFMALYTDHHCLVQLTTDGNGNARRKKMLDTKGLYHWVKGGGRVGLLTYKRHVSAGGAISYSPKYVDMTEEFNR